jgi:peptidoglycan/LPS O-acetylase OafA/YrhL
MDNLRWVTVLLVLFYHVIYFYNNKGVFGGIGGFSKYPECKQYQDIVMYILYPWFMMLLFLVAGISSRYALEKMSASRFLGSRALKLLVPATIGLFVFQWMTGYFNTQVAALAQGTDLFADIPETVPNGIKIIIKYFAYSLSGIGPLWFIQDLWIFSLLIVLIKKLDKNDRFWNWCGKANIPVIILLGVLIWLASQTLIMNPRKDSPDGLYNLYKPLAYFVPFLMGYFVFSHDAVQERVKKMHWPMLICAVCACVALCWTGWGQDNTTPQFLSGWLNCLYAWLMILAMLGCFKAWFDKTNKFATYMTQSSFGIYVMHYLVIASLGYMMKMYTNLAPWMMYVILFVAVMTIPFALYEIIKRIPFIRWCVLGMKKKTKTQ